MNLAVELGYFGLFVIAFLASTVLPLSSEIVLSTLLLNKFSPIILVAVATLGNVSGSVVNYLIGCWANIDRIKTWLKIDSKRLEKAENMFNKYGVVSLCFAWVPIVGDPLTVIAGMLRVKIHWFVLLVTIGKLGRYILVVFFTNQSFG